MFEEFSKQLNLCKTCPSLCQSACPVFINDGNKTHSPQGLMQLVNNVRHKQLPFDEQIASEAYHCLECRACTQACEHHVDVPQILRQVRTEAIRQELAPQPINTFIERFHKHNNPFARDLAGKLRSLLPARYFNANASAIYFSSCTTIAKCPEVIRDTFALFNKLKIDFVNLYADPIHCCGYPLLCCGAEYEFVDLAEINFHSLKKFKTIITNCPACAHTLKHTYAKYAFNLEAQVITISDFLKPYLKPLRAALKKNIRTKTIFHDSCYATRYLDDPDTSRDIITQATGHAPTRFYDHGAQCACCGQGSAYPIVAREQADRITRKKLEEVYEKNIQTVITACPICLYKIRQQGKRLIVKDFVSYLNDCVGNAST